MLTASGMLLTRRTFYSGLWYASGLNDLFLKASGMLLAWNEIL
jgi:hypothetical protein